MFAWSLQYVSMPRKLGNVTYRMILINHTHTHTRTHYPLTPNDPYSVRTALLTSKVAFYIFIQQI